MGKTLFVMRLQMIALFCIALCLSCVKSETSEDKLKRLVKNLDPPAMMAACTDHHDCKDYSVRGYSGQYCAKYGQNKCSFKKDGNTWCFEDEECISGRCHISQCTFAWDLQF